MAAKPDPLTHPHPYPHLKLGEIMAAFERSYGPKRDMLTMIAQLDSQAQHA